MDLGAKIRAFRKRRGLSLTELSARTGIAASNLSSIELNKSSPTLATLIKIAEAFGMKPGALLDGVLYTKAVVCRVLPPEESGPADPVAHEQRLTSEIFLRGLDASVISIEPHSEPLPAGMQGTDRFAYCLEGQFTAVVDGGAHVVNTGEAIYLLPEAAVFVTNPTDQRTRILIVATVG